MHVLKLHRLPLLIFFIAIIWGWILYVTGLHITGPFIFGDESTYFDFARSIFYKKELDAFTQYGPLYPAIISVAFLAKTFITCYKLIKVLNILLFMLAVIPAYLLSKELFQNVWLRWLLSFWVLFTPFSSFVYLVWAEPLYIALFYFSIWFLYLFIKRPSLVRGLLLGIFVASLFYTKTAAGLIAEIAFFIALGFYLIGNNQKSLSFFALLICGMFTLPWMLHYKHLGVSVIGYPVATKALAVQLNNGVLPLFSKLMLSFFYQLSYVIIGTWAMIGVGCTLLITQWEKIDVPEKILMLFLILCITGLMFLNALGMVTVPGLDYHMPNGRYYSLLFPVITVLSLSWIFRTKIERKDFFIVLLILLVMAGITYIATPLYTRNPFSFNTMPDLASIIYLSDHGKFVWRPMMEMPSATLRLSVVLFFCGVAFLIFMFRHKRFVVGIISIFMSIYVLMTGLDERYYMHGIAVGQSSLNNIYIRLVKNHISILEVSFDRELKDSNVQFLTPFWMDCLPQFSNEKSVKTRYFVSQKNLELNKVFVSDSYTIYQKKVG